MTGKTTRRNFLMTGVAIAGSIVGTSSCQSSDPPTVSQSSAASPPSPLPAAPSPIDRPIPERILGRTGLSMPIFGLGGAGRTPLSRPGEEREAIAIIERALELGVRYFDTASSYGPSEERLGKVIPPHRSKLIVASKTGSRDRDGAWRNLEQSLTRLNTDYLDLWHFHALTYDWDLDTILHEQQGAIRAAQEAQQQGLVRYLGISGHHNPGILAKAIDRYPFDVALVALNAADKHTPDPFITGLLPTARQHNTGIIGMKIPAYGRLLDTGTLTGMPQAMGYVLSQPGVHTCTIAAESVAQLEANVEVAQAFQPLTAQELRAIEQHTASGWKEFSFFRDWA